MSHLSVGKGRNLNEQLVLTVSPLAFHSSQAQVNGADPALGTGGYCGGQWGFHSSPGDLSLELSSSDFPGLARVDFRNLV